ncbi:MAG TPA: hypothetical protein VFG83_10375, partial [Kofleriaceae bacterium]|nr:hypothetical protein [Kofleriaceae bacterium]
RYVDACPDDADGHATLGLCLLALGHPDAGEHFARAAAIEPENRLHAWNLAAAAHGAGHPSRCYLALCRYLSLPAPPIEPDAAANERAARAYMAEYERQSRLCHPEQAPETVARADDLAAAARANL